MNEKQTITRDINKLDNKYFMYLRINFDKVSTRTTPWIENNKDDDAYLRCIFSY